jgi:hypothetical protein
MTDKERIEQMLKEDIELTRQIERIVMRMNASVAMLRQEIREVTWSYEEELARLRRRKDEIRNEVLGMWGEHFDKNTIQFPFAKVTRRNYRELIVHDRFALLDALDRAGRLDLVEYAFKESEVARLIERGKLGDLDGKVEVKSNLKLLVKAVKEGNDG